ncbi:MAG: ribosomal RNA small subunit methyltransferase A [Phycisphaeraceae bacterium]|nr:MAG: ribosomal RNA small subunit methyltransferase A [Phycisphaeraceae bacterium]
MEYFGALALCCFAAFLLSLCASVSLWFSPRYTSHVLTLKELRLLLDERGLRPRHALGQNFLIDHNLLNKLVDAAGVGSGDVVLEVGPGPGQLTEALLSRGAQVVACELDDGLSELLEDRLADTAAGRLTLIRGDCLESKTRLNPRLVSALCGRPFKLVANLPYGAASPLMLTLLLKHPECASLHVTIQKEVAHRLAAPPGSRDYGELSVIAQSLATIERIADAPPECFWPRPKVTSAMISITRRAQPLTQDADSLERLCKRLFQKRRKQLGAILGRDVAWPEGIEPSMRPEQLSVEQIEALAKVVGE